VILADVDVLISAHREDAADHDRFETSAREFLPGVISPSAHDMGQTAKTRIRVDGTLHDGEALLETSEVIVRAKGAHVGSIPFAEMKSLRASDGALSFRFDGRDISIDLGANAAKWLEKIRNPKSVVQKLGVKSGQKIALLGVDDDDFARDLESLGATIARGRAAKNTDAIFFGAATRADLARLAKLRQSLAPDGALWIIRPRGVKEITESEVMAAGRAAGFVDVKVVRFSETHTAEKFVIPVSARR
jgi:hypothetical protein